MGVELPSARREWPSRLWAIPAVPTGARPLSAASSAGDLARLLVDHQAVCRQHRDARPSRSRGIPAASALNQNRAGVRLPIVPMIPHMLLSPITFDNQPLLAPAVELGVVTCCHGQRSSAPLSRAQSPGGRPSRFFKWLSARSFRLCDDGGSRCGNGARRSSHSSNVRDPGRPRRPLMYTPAVMCIARDEREAPPAPPLSCTIRANFLVNVHVLALLAGLEPKIGRLRFHGYSTRTQRNPKLSIQCP